MPKTEFYDAYGAAHPNVFGMRDEALHSVRRRHMSHSFSMAYIKDMENYLDGNIQIQKDEIQSHINRNETFDLKKILHYYVIDVLGELAFSQSFAVQQSDDESRVPPVVEHSLLAAVTGSWPMMTMALKKYLPYVPHAGLKSLFAGRKACADLASVSIDRRLAGLSVAKTSLTVCNHAFHHNPVVWGEVHNIFNPTRWDEPSITAKSRLLMHFGLGGRQCIGKTVATANIYKLLSTLLREFQFVLASEQERAGVANGLYKGKIPEMFSVGISDLKGPLLVRARNR
ncbi:benzoate 4-monooxygenase cytochrome P450 [Talaromyces pinophilus]|uniref:Benzoate 4-monooxygenase cytochrome P450 n=1 Tax=Talaromyces pinophilus TaxID=128442 RepID=A0A0B8N2J5_TALPI|nr:benzoate 4-monooxygenase cytochrome P450 [Talaromyces pinophilus]